MDASLLVASQLSALFPTSYPIPVTSSQNDILHQPYQSNSETPPEHASFSTLFHTPASGTILLRLTHGGLVLELVSLTSDIPPVRFEFPAAVVPSPSILLWSPEEVHVLAVTTYGSLYRLVLPIRDGAPQWQTTSRRKWFREYVIENLKGILPGPVQVQSTHCVAIGLEDGSLLRLETERLGTEFDDDVWKETVFHHRSFLNSIASLIPLHASGPPGGSEIISIASHPQPTDIAHIWTISRDRSLRLWTPRSGCVAERILSSSNPSKTTISTSTPNSAKSVVLLPSDPQQLLCVFHATASEAEHVLAFIPTESSTSSGGYFHLFDASDDNIRSVKIFEASMSSVHCHLQHFLVDGDSLYTLWDRQGQSMVEKVESLFRDPEVKDEDWRNITYASEAELTPAYLDELLLSPGSLTDKFFEAIMCPGIFSPLTLQAAISQYTEACYSLPSPPPPQLLTTYATVGENIAAVVGCTVQLTRDPHTGALQHAKYRNAIKRDWEGFIARCREVERSARWPLALGVGDSKNGVVVIERERIASVVEEDLPLRLHRQLTISLPLEPQFSLLDILWTLRTKIGPKAMLTLENRLIDLAHQEIAFPYADIIQDQAQRIYFRDDVDEGLENWIIGRLQSVGNVEGATRTILDIIGGFDKAVKREEDEVELLLPTVNQEWTRALTAAYVTSTVQARYDLCLSLMTLLFFLSDDLHQWDPSLLAEIFVVFRGVAMLRYVVRQPAGDSVTPSPSTDMLATEDEDVSTRMRNMHVSSGPSSYFSPTYSLVHRLVAQYSGASGSSFLPSSAHQFLDATGLLQSLTPAHATKLEVLFCERMRLLGYRHVARELLAWLPRTPGVTYVLGRLWLDEGRYDDAASVFEGLAGSFGPGNALSLEDQQALAAVLPRAELFDSEFNFYLHASGLFRAASVTSHEVLFTQRSLSVAPSGVDSTDLWHAAIKGLTDLGLWEDAYTTLVAAPYDRLQRECISQLVYRMCEEHAVDRLMTFNFAGLADEVEDALAFKARNADPRIRPFYSRILYTWYISRGDYRNAALTMYQRARKLASPVVDDRSELIHLAELQLEAYVVAMNALSLLEQKNAWIVMPVTAEAEHEPRKRRKLSKHIPEGKYALGKRDVEIVDLGDMQYEYSLLASRLELIRRDPTLLSADWLLSPPSIVMRLAQSNRFNTAMSTARSLNVDMSDLFGYLTGQCLRLSQNPDAVMGEDTSDWLLTDKVSSWPGTPADRGWRYLRQSLERHDGPDTDYKYSKVTLESILAFDRSSPPPPWLIHLLEDQHPEYLIRTCLRYDVLESALEHTLAFIKRSDSSLNEEQPKAASMTWLPYTLIDQVLLAAESHSDLSRRGQSIQKELRAEISNRIKRVQKFTQSL